MTLRFIFAIIAIGCGICAALAFNIPGPTFFILTACCIGFGAVSSYMSYGTAVKPEEDTWS